MVSTRKYSIGVLLLLLAFSGLILAAGCLSATSTAQPAPEQTAVPTRSQYSGELAPLTPVNPAVPELSIPLPRVTPAAIIGRLSFESMNDSLKVSRNDSVLVVLAENPTTGFQWNVVYTDGLDVTADRYICPEVNRPGAGGIHTWEVRANQTGNETFEGFYQRPWENDTPPAAVYRLNMSVDR